MTFLATADETDGQFAMNAIEGGQGAEPAPITSAGFEKFFRTMGKSNGIHGHSLGAAAYL